MDYACFTPPSSGWADCEALPVLWQWERRQGAEAAIVRSGTTTLTYQNYFPQILGSPAYPHRLFAPPPRPPRPNNNNNNK